MDSNHVQDIRVTVSLPEYLKRWPGLYVRVDNQIVEASEEDSSVARSYPTTPNKGQIFDGKRLTLLTKKTSYQVNEEIRVIHVVEVTEVGHQVYVMGPKPIYGEYIDSRLVRDPLPKGADHLIPSIYSGATLPSPAVDYNYEITSYVFSESGIHEIYWELGELKSNVITIEVTKQR